MAIKIKFVAYRIGKKSNKALECKALKTEGMARNFVSYWNTVPKCKAFIAKHVCTTDHFGITQYGDSIAIEQ